MRHTPEYLLTDEREVRRLVAENPWATIVSSPASGLIASHYPVLLDDTGDELVLLSHVGRPDERLHDLGNHEVLVIIQGAHGYISPSWYDDDGFVPTWNHVTAHLWGTPEILSSEENFSVLDSLVRRFEDRMPDPVYLDVDETQARGIARGTVGIRIPITRVDARLKLSQSKRPATIRRIIAELEGDGPFASAGLAREMRRVHGPALSTGAESGNTP